MKPKQDSTIYEIPKYLLDQAKVVTERFIILVSKHIKMDP